LRAGVEVKLAPGWKTYWRYPGDSGVPPRFDFTRSRNVESVTVAWPAPRRFSESSDQVIGYKDAVTLPLRIKAADPSQPVDLDLKLDYAICDKLCIPVEAEARLAIDGSGGTQDAALAAAEARIPRHATLGEGTPAITGIRRDAGKRVVVDVTAPPDTPVDLFVEGPTPEWALPLPEPLPAADGARRFAFELDGLPSGAQAGGAVLRFTLVSPTGSVEVAHALR
jgi:DsbC/DsbD-like thiol-disulfide interchange protein